MKMFSPAKINLFLHVTGKRPDGYHELFTLMCRINLMDTVMLDFHAQQTSVSCAHPMVPEDQSNLAFKAAATFYKSFGKDDGVGITIDKKIPVGGGLGGGSSNAAAVLMGLAPWQRFVLSLFLFLDVALMGCMCLLMAGKVVPFR